MNRSVTLFRALLAAALLAGPSGAVVAKDAPDPCGTKSVPNLPSPGDENEDLIVKGGVCTVTAGTYKYRNVTIHNGGTLKLTDANIDLTVKSIVITMGGAMITDGGASTPIGTANRTNRVVVRFVGVRPANVMAGMAHAHEAKAGGADDCSAVDKGIAVMRGGRLALFGARGVAPDDGRSARIGGENLGTVSWTYLAEPAGPAKYKSLVGIGSKVGADGDKTLVVPLDVSKHWNPGDWLVIGTTSYSPFESEFVRIAAAADAVTFAGKVTTIKLDDATPLRHYHFGMPDPGRPSDANRSADEKTNYGVDERAEVGLVSRSIVLTAKTPDYATAPAADTSLAWGGETRFCEGFAEAKLQGLELEKFGKDKLGSYPIHLHMAGPVAAGTALFNSNSIHHSYNHCIAVHMTNDVTFANNVCARIIGHIFYEEKPKDTPGHIIENTGLKFHDNLGIGAMANGFGLPTFNGKQVTPGFWEGDYLARDGDGYYPLHVANTDDQTLAVHGLCYVLNKSTGALEAGTPPPCPADRIYFEPPSGFWTVNPGTEIIGNSVGGCQSLGKAFWYVPPDLTLGGRVQLKFQPVGKFVNNRAHACYDGLFGEEDGGIKSTQLFPKLESNLVMKNLFARFDALTVFRIRNRGIWMRPSWFVVENARVATSREGVTLVTSGGLDGNAPGVWGLLKSSTIVGVSMNNVDRWGPCAGKNLLEGPGCVDWNKDSATLFEKGYPSPGWNFAGFYIYDGPARIHDVRFVNFHVDPAKMLLTDEDVKIQKAFTNYPAGKVYEGDAALGWFQANQSAYPTATDVRALRFDSVDLRHQVFTELVNLGPFDDGDKNTAIIDRDGSLTGFKVVSATGAPVHDDYPISLNNLPFNAAANAVDECHAEGAQDTLAEGRPTSLISPANYGTLEFEAFTLPEGIVPPKPGDKDPPNRLTQLVTFTKDTVDYGGHHSMTLHSRNNQGIWEPKVASGHGYTITAQAAIDPKYKDTRRDPGFPRQVSIGLNDIVMPRISAKDPGNPKSVDNPFYVRVGVCYTNKDGTHPDGNFEIKRGYRSWAGGDVEGTDPDLRKLYVRLDLEYQSERCFNLSDANRDNINDPVKGCPAHGITPKGDDACPFGSFETTQRNNLAVCAFPPTPLTETKDYRELTNVDGTYKSLDKWYYDKTTGMLFFYLKQDRPNAKGTSPLGSCTGDGSNDSACPKPNDPTYPESYYACPPEGCPTYSVRLSSNTPYDPGPSACTTSDPASIYKAKREYAQDPLTGVNQLAFVVPGGTSPKPTFPDGGIVKEKDCTAPDAANGCLLTTKPAFPHRIATYAGSAVSPICTGKP